MALPRRAIASLAALSLLLSLTVCLVETAQPAAAGVPILVVDGRGWGHGVGMAQDGAFWMAKAGANLQQIIGHFYPGTSFANATGPVRVAVRGPGADVVVAFPAGGEIRDALSGQQSPGFPVNVPPGGSVRMRFDGARFIVSGGTPTGTAASPAPASAGSSTGATETAAGQPASSTYAAERLMAMRVSRSASARSQTFPGSGSGQSSPTPSITLPGGNPSSTTTSSPPPTSPTPSPPPTLGPPPGSPGSGPGQSTTTTTTAPGPGPGVPTTTPSTVPSASTTTTAPPPPPPAGQPAPGAPGAVEPSSTRPLWAVPSGDSTVALPERGRQYRGVLQTVAAGNQIRLLDQLDVETYLKGMGEVRDPSWPLAALQTQAVAARTYALRAMAAGGELCDDTRCQVYLGAQAEYAAMNKAVDSSAHKVVAFGNSLASTVYSANAGGFSATPLEGFGSNSDFPYLRAEPYTTGDPMPWSVRIALTDLAARFGYAGTITDVKVSEPGPSGRALTIELDGSAGPMSVPGLKFASGLGLRSTLVALHIETADAAPPPPAPADLIQAPPDDAAALAAAPTAAAGDVTAAPSVDTGAAVPANLRPKLHEAGASRSGGLLVLLSLTALALLAVVAMAVTPQGRRIAAPALARYASLVPKRWRRPS